MENQGQYTYQWMKEVVNSMKQSMGWSEIEKQNSFKITQTSLDLTCQYTKSRLKHPAKTSNCNHIYCMEQQVLEQTKECICKQVVSLDNPIQPAKLTQQIIDYMHLKGFNQTAVMIIFTHGCFFPIHKGKIIYLPQELLLDIVMEHSKDNKVSWSCEHLTQIMNIAEVVFVITTPKCNCGVSSLIKPRTKIKLKLQ